MFISTCASIHTCNSVANKVSSTTLHKWSLDVVNRSDCIGSQMSLKKSVCQKKITEIWAVQFSSTVQTAWLIKKYIIFRSQKLVFRTSLTWLGNRASQAFLHQTFVWYIVFESHPWGSIQLFSSRSGLTVSDLIYQFLHIWFISARYDLSVLGCPLGYARNSLMPSQFDTLQTGAFSSLILDLVERPLSKVGSLKATAVPVP